MLFLVLPAREVQSQSLKDILQGKIKEIKQENACRKETIVDLENLFSLILSGIFTPTSFVEVEPNDAPVFSNKIGLNGLASGVLENERDKDYWKVYVPEEGEVGIAVSSRETGVRAVLYRYRYKKELKEGDEPFTTIQKFSIHLQKGLYFVALSSRASRQNPYTLRVTFLPSSLP